MGVPLKHHVFLVAHTQLLSNAGRGEVSGVDHGDKARQVENVKAVITNRKGSFCGVALVLKPFFQTIPDFYFGLSGYISKIEQAAVTYSLAGAFFD